MQRIAFFIYGVVGHLLFLAVYAWLAAFVGGFLPQSVDAPATDARLLALGVDASLIALFALQHSIMARPAFKRVWTRIVPQPIERSTYVYAANAVTALLIWQWSPIDMVVWDVSHPVGRGILWGMFAFGWLMVPAVSLMIHHFDLFGTRQVWLHLRGREYTPLPFRTPYLYSHIRHPLYIGWMIAFWAAPTMTLGHFVLAAGMTGYMLLAVVFEERDLVKHFGALYQEYRQHVPMFVPRRRARLSAVRFDGQVLADPSWWHWAITVALLAAHLAGVQGALAAAAALCAGMSACFFIRLRAVRPFPVQIRLAYLVLLGVGTWPGMAWVHWIQLVGSTLMVTTGYCLLARGLTLLPFNRSEPLNRSTFQQIFLTSTVGGLLRWRSSPTIAKVECCSPRAMAC